MSENTKTDVTDIEKTIAKLASTTGINVEEAAKKVLGDDGKLDDLLKKIDISKITSLVKEMNNANDSDENDTLKSMVNMAKTSGLAESLLGVTANKKGEEK